MMLSKKFVTLVLIGLFLGVNAAYAIAGDNNFIVCDSHTGNPSDTVIVTVSMPDPNGLAGVQFSVTYDNRYLSINDIDADDDGYPDGIVFPAGKGFNLRSVSVFNQKGKANFAIISSSAEPLKGAGETVLAQIKFIIKEDTPNGTYSISIVDYLADGGGVTVPIGASINGAITVEGGADPQTSLDTAPIVTSPAQTDSVKPVSQPQVKPTTVETSSTIKAVELKDIADHWAEPYIVQMVAAQVISGYPDNTFRPDNTISRAEFTTLLVRAFQFDLKNGQVFDDTREHWAKDYIAAAYSHGWVNGLSDKIFAPDLPITREQMAFMIVKAVDLKPLSDTKAFSDADQISDWAKEFVNTAAGHAVISGYPDNTFRPQGNATRAEAVTVIVKRLAVRNK